MGSRLTIALVGIVILPLAIVGWLVGRTARHERVVAEQQFSELARFRLEQIDRQLVELFDAVLGGIVDDLDTPPQTIDECRQWADDSLVAEQLYVVNPQRALVFPAIADPGALTASEREALRRTEMIWDEGALVAEVLGRGDTPEQQQSSSGWFTWYWGGGVRWIAWLRNPEAIYAVELDRARMLSEIVNALPDTRFDDDELVAAQIRLTDSSGHIVYQWGQHEPAEEDPPITSLAVANPLSAWSFEYHAPALASGVASNIGLFAGVAAVMIAIGALGIYLHREQSRSLREAGQRVSFVNQVSHELKTPLTNIRMYAELLSDDIGDSGASSGNRLDVIVSESQRLSRLINNVLTFSGKQKQQLRLHRKPTVVDDVVRTVVESFRPLLESKSIATRLALDAPGVVDADPDRLEQIIGNLVSNVEKYAADGRHLGIVTRVLDGHVELCVEDHGRGIPKPETESVFRPFYRIENSLTEGVSGTGIGLSIARDLARLHGGDLRYEPSEEGSLFRLTIPIQAERS